MNYRKFRDVFEKRNYPSGETHLILRHLRFDPEDHNVIEHHLRNWGNIGDLLTAHQTFLRRGIEVTWFCPFLPFARDDRRETKLHCSELETFLDLLETYDVDLVCADPHSDACSRVRQIKQADTFETLREEYLEINVYRPTYIIPDAGATKKALTWLGDKPAIQALKRRDLQTGDLSGFELLGKPAKDRRCVIVDDICDGGGTFLGLAKLLRQVGIKNIDLIVTHGLFTKGERLLTDVFDNVYTFGDLNMPNNKTNTVPWETLYRYAYTRKTII